MARITINDCLENVDNHFELVLLASRRARQLSRHNIEPMVSWDDDDAPVVALREIAAGHINKNNIIKDQNIHHAIDHFDENLLKNLTDFDL